MRNILIAVDSSANLKNEGNIKSVPLKIILGEKSFIDDENINIEEFLNACASYQGKSSSSCPSSGEWEEAFSDTEEVIAFAITSKLSGCYNSCEVAKQMALEKNPNRKIHVFDSLTTGPEMLLLVEKTQELIAKDLSFEDIIKEITSYMESTELHFVLKSLDNFAKNGRVSFALAKIASLLHIYIVGKATEGTLDPTNKSHGEIKSLKQLYLNIKNDGYKGGKVRITHTDNLKLATSLKNKILEEFPQADIQISINKGLCSYYAERGGVLVGFEK